MATTEVQERQRQFMTSVMTGRKTDRDVVVFYVNSLYEALGFKKPKQILHAPSLPAAFEMVNGLGLSPEDGEESASHSFRVAEFKGMCGHYHKGNDQAYRDVVMPTRPECHRASDRVIEVATGQEVLKDRGHLKNMIAFTMTSCYSIWYQESVLSEGLAKSPAMDCFVELCNELSFMFMYEGVVICVDRHTADIKYDEDGNLHCEDGPCVEYSDGSGPYSIKGVSVPEQVVMAPETQTIEQILAEDNMEVRRIRIERYGPDKFAADSGAKIIDGTFDMDGIGELLVELKTGDRILFVSCTSSGRNYSIDVPPETQTTTEAQEYLISKDTAFQGIDLPKMASGPIAQS